ncbi:MAG TPA: TlpA disulfide reductase family protein [Gemmataceae bacterium]|nr:TlpA disulfide reductase family protein [Gemmataceae bacterium]
MYPHERSLVNKLTDKPFVILGINSDSNREELKKVMEKEQITWRSWWDGGNTRGPIASQWNVQGWPTLYLLDHKGVIVDKSVGSRDMDHRIEQLVAAAEGKSSERAEATAGQGERKEPAKLPEGLSKITAEDLRTKVPNFFSFDYTGEPQPGKRYWIRVDKNHWIERYPDGAESKFKILGRATVQGNHGTVAVKIEGDPEKTLTDNNGGFQVFVPDKGSREMVIRCRLVGGGDSEWINLAGMQNVD